MKLTEPCDTAVIKPALLMVATPGALDVQVPPEVGVTVDVCPIQSAFGPVNETVGLRLTVTGAVLTDTQP